MDWFLIALIGPVLYAATNHIDKYLISKYFRGGEVGSLVMFSSLFSAIVLPIIALFHPAVFAIDFKGALILVVNGVVDIIPIILYLKALRDDDPSRVVPYYQTIPVFTFVLGYFVLGEWLTFSQGIACLLIVAGTVLISLKITKRGVSFKKRVAFLMLVASLLYAVTGVVFKWVAVEDGFWVSAFWQFLGRLIFGIALFAFIKSYRDEFLHVLKGNSLSVLSLNSLNELIFAAAELTSIFATLLAPIVLVTTVNGLQPFFVFVFGVILTLFFPKIEKEALSKKDVIQKVSAIGIITLGTIILGMSSAL